jgi:hypothetical protein
MKACFIALLSVGLVGCTGMSSNFQCNVPSGGLCASMSQVNRLVDEDQLPGLIPTQAVTYVRIEEGKK